MSAVPVLVPPGVDAVSRHVVACGMGIGYGPGWRPVVLVSIIPVRCCPGCAADATAGPLRHRPDCPAPTTSDIPRGSCPGCGREFALRRDGRPRQHRCPPEVAS
jgi:hypothetical protein